ncbi:MAG: hypothetical protein QOD61_2478, partial [Solirubrobacteraceae bacterium]|nr:hypothetical protein [Solirubrobacteraceae bacterium]
EILFSAAPAYEFCDWGGAHHVGGGSHGSLHASDSLAPLICAGLSGEIHREQWSIKDVAPLVRAHFGLHPGGVPPAAAGGAGGGRARRRAGPGAPASPELEAGVPAAVVVVDALDAAGGEIGSGSGD